MSSTAPTPQSQLDKPSLLAAARLQHHITDLQTRVSASTPAPLPPRRKAFHIVPDSTALSSPAIADLKALLQSRRLAALTIPFSALAELDRLKKGSDDVNVNARAAIRWFDKGGAGLRVQQPQETVAGAPDPVVGCALFVEGGAEVVICTDDEERAAVARGCGVRCVGSWEVEGLVVREEAEFNERKRVWNAAQRGGGPRGGRGGGGGHRGGKIVIDPEEFGRGGRRLGGWVGGGGGGRGGDGYVLKGPQRGVQRGRGKLWEP